MYAKYYEYIYIYIYVGWGLETTQQDNFIRIFSDWIYTEKFILAVDKFLITHVIYQLKS